MEFTSVYFIFSFSFLSMIHYLQREEGEKKRQKIYFVMAYKCCAVYCRFNYSGEEVAVIFDFPRDVYISKFSSITRLKI